MDENPYQSPRESNELTPSTRNIFGLRRKPLWGYAVAVVAGVLFGGVFLLPATAALDDTGGIQMLVGGFLGAVVYGLMF